MPRVDKPLVGIDFKRPGSKITYQGLKYTWHDEGSLYGPNNNDDQPAVVKIEPKTNRVVRASWYTNGRLDREGAPAVISVYPDDTPERYVYWKYDKLHREDGPAAIHFNEQGKVEWYSFYLNGEHVYEEMFDNVEYGSDIYWFNLEILGMTNANNERQA